MTTLACSEGLRMARSIEQTALQEAGPSEEARTLSAPLVEALWDSGLMQFMNPTAAGGHEPGFAELIETWLEMALQDVFVPWHRTYPLFTRESMRGGPLYRFGIMPLTGCGHAAWALGVARSAIDDVFELAREKTRMGDDNSIAHKLTFQRNLAHHEGMWRAN